MSFRPHPEPSPMLFGYDPVRDLGSTHLARLVEAVVEETIQPRSRSREGQPGFDPRLAIKILVYGYARGVRSSRRLEQLCNEDLGFLFLTRGDTPCYRTLCSARLAYASEMEAVWVGLFAIGREAGIPQLGRITLDSTKIRANASGESVVRAHEYAAVQETLRQVLAEAQATDQAEDENGPHVVTDLGQKVERTHMRDILRRSRRELRRRGKSDPGKSDPGKSDPGKSDPGEGSPDKGSPGKSADAASNEVTELASVEVVAVEIPADAAASPPRILTKEMRVRVELALETLEAAQKAGLNHVTLTDPDARMMPEGCEKKLRECHCFEVATDNGLLMAGNRAPDGVDNRRLIPLVQMAAPFEADGILSVTTDAGYYSSEQVAALARAGVDLCIPDSNTACDLRRGQPLGTTQNQQRSPVEFQYDAATDSYTCEQGNELTFQRQRRQSEKEIRLYQVQKPCRTEAGVSCPMADQCLGNDKTQRRTLSVPVEGDILARERQRFAQKEHQQRYWQRGPQVETVFGFLRGTLGYRQWMLRGAKGVAQEIKLMKTAYQLRKIHLVWAAKTDLIRTKEKKIVPRTTAVRLNHTNFPIYC